MNVTLSPAALCGSVQVPPSKSMAHRAILAAALAQGTTRVENLIYSDDISATLAAAERLGASVTRYGAACDITGCGGVPQLTGDDAVFCNESGSTLRFLIPLCSLTGRAVRFTGKGRLLARPQNIYAALFHERGLIFEQTEQSIFIDGALTAGEYRLDGSVSSQFITGLLFALPLLDGDSTLRIAPPFESRSYVHLTLAALRDFGIEATWQDENTLFVRGGQRYRAKARYVVEGDDSQAAFWAVLGSVCGGITVHGVREASQQGDAAIYSILQRCGAKFTRGNGTLQFEKAPLCATQIDLADCPDLGPILMVLGLFCKGETTITNAQRLRIKESDRIAAMESEIRAMGGRIASTESSITISQSTLHSAALAGHGDHRIVMAISVAALAAGVCVTIAGAEAVAKSYPSFFNDVRAVGGSVEET